MKQGSTKLSFSGYSKAALDFLAGLDDKDKDWFASNKKIYTSELVTPTKLFVAALGERLAETLTPRIVAIPKTNGSIGPINNDLRFSPGKPPYKDHLLLRFWEGENKRTAPTLMVRISKSTVGFATGAAINDLDRWRKLIDEEPGSRLAELIADLEKGRELDVEGQGYKNVPKPYDQTHPRAELLKHRSFQARWLRPTPPEIHNSSFVDWVAEQLSDTAEIHRWLVANVNP